MLQDLEGMCNISDYIIIVSESDDEHKTCEGLCGETVGEGIDSEQDKSGHF